MRPFVDAFRPPPSDERGLRGESQGFFGRGRSPQCTQHWLCCLSGCRLVPNTHFRDRAAAQAPHRRLLLTIGRLAPQATIGGSRSPFAGKMCRESEYKCEPCVSLSSYEVPSACRCGPPTRGSCLSCLCKLGLCSSKIARRHFRPEYRPSCKVVVSLRICCGSLSSLFRIVRIPIA